MVSAIGGLVFNTMPLLLSSAGAEFNMSASTLGSLSLTAGIGYLIGTITTPLWVDRVKWKPMAGLIVLSVAAAFGICSTLTGQALFAGFAVFGFLCALAIGLAMRVLAIMPEPERAFGTRLSVELISIGLFLTVLPTLFIAKAGFSGAMYGLCAFTLLLGLGAFLMPNRQVDNNMDAASPKRLTYPSWNAASNGWTILGIFLIYLLANVGLFFFLAFIAQDFKPTPEQFGLMFGGLKWLGGVAGLVGAIIGARLGLRLPHFLSALLLILGVLGLFLTQNFTIFMISSWVWEFGFTLGCLYLTSSISRFDPSRKLVMLVPAAFGLSMIFGGKIAGQLLESGSPNGLYMLVGLCSFLPTLYLYMTRIAPPTIAELSETEKGVIT